MLSDRAKSSKHRIRPCPEAKLRVNEECEFIDRRKGVIVNPKPTEQFPDAFNGVELRTIGGEKQQREIRFMRLAPRRMEHGVMVPGIVNDDDHTSARPSTDDAQMAEKPPTSLRIEVTRWRQRAQFAISQSYRPEITDAFSGRSVNAYRILNLRRDPHAAATAVLVEVDFIQRPQIHLGIGGQQVEFFLLWLALLHRVCPLPAGACANGIRVVGRVAGIAAPVESRRTLSLEMPTAADRPTVALAIHDRRGCRAELVPLWHAALRSSAPAV